MPFVAGMRTTATAILILTVLTSNLFGGEGSATMTVTARVIARATVDVHQQPSEVLVTNEDVKRGYVDVADPLAVRVRTNSQNGYLLQVSNGSQTFSAIELAFGDTSMTVSHESWIARPYVPAGEVVNARVRVRLAPGISPGRHPLPIEVSASPL
ncbi:MAG TPA: hypothetical protein VFT12_11420 [Thermoanaerobaculia bacterium]|nr:hypothetical protein [Thermoanaerobaculia bacterium]